MSVFKPENMELAEPDDLRTEGVPSIELKLRGDAATQGAACPPKTEPETPWDWMLLDRTNARAFSQWNIGRQNPHLPPAPDGSGCSYHYCWMPCVRNDGEGEQFCAAHGGTDAPLPLWPLRDMRDRTADALADEVDLLVRNKVIDSRSPTADALLDYRNNPRTPRSDRLKALEAETARLRGELQKLRTDGATIASKPNPGFEARSKAHARLCALYRRRDELRQQGASAQEMAQALDQVRAAEAEVSQLIDAQLMASLPVPLDEVAALRTHIDHLLRKDKP